MTVKKKILYPIFSEASQYTFDPYWQQIFENCANGKFPKGVSIDNEKKILYIKNVNSFNSYNLNNESPENIYINIKKLFSTILNLKSTRDKRLQQQECDDICKELDESYNEDWQKIKRKKIRDPIIRKYILALKEKYNLDNSSTTELDNIIKLGFLFNWIGNENVIYENREIIDINTLNYDPELKIFKLDIPDFSYKREYKIKNNKLSTLWEKHLIVPKNMYIL